MSLWFHFDVTLISLRFHFDLTLISLRFHFDLTSISLWFHVNVTLISLRFHFDFTLISLWFYFDITQGKRDSLAGEKGKGKRAIVTFSSVLTRHCHRASHARTRRNDFPVGAAALLPPPDLRYFTKNKGFTTRQGLHYYTKAPLLYKGFPTTIQRGLMTTIERRYYYTRALLLYKGFAKLNESKKHKRN
jgi:hypothetical protein